jgi:methylmalonyl-CoA mutase
MKSTADLFAGFPPVSKQEWLDRIAKDLKGKPLEDLYWHLSDALIVDPFGHPDDLQGIPEISVRQSGGWEICEQIDTADPAAANKQALEALQFGAEGLYFHLHSLDSAVFDQVFAGIHPDFIGLHFSTADWHQLPSGGVLAKLHYLADAKAVQTDALRGSIGYDPLALPGIRDWRYLTDVAGYAAGQFPKFRTIGVGGESTGAPATIPDELAAMLFKGHTYVQKLTKHGLSPADAAAQLTFSMQVGKSYFPEIAKLRAFRLLWLNVMKAWGAVADPVVAVSFAPNAYTDDPYNNMIRATTMAMSAVLGGADRLTVLPSDAGHESPEPASRQFSRRIARNVQHLLKMESGLDEIADPAAGSYYIEKLTRQLATVAWSRFQDQCKSPQPKQ